MWLRLKQFGSCQARTWLHWDKFSLRWSFGQIQWSDLFQPLLYPPISQFISFIQSLPDFLVPSVKLGLFLIFMCCYCSFQQMNQASPLGQAHTLCCTVLSQDLSLCQKCHSRVAKSPHVRSFAKQTFCHLLIIKYNNLISFYIYCYNVNLINFYVNFCAKVFHSALAT